MTNSAETLLAMRAELEKIAKITDTEWRKFSSVTKVLQVPEKYILQEAGQAVKHHHFLVDGLVRLFYTTPEGKDINKCFYGNNHIIGNLSAIILEEPSRFAIETLEPCTLVQFPIANLDTLSSNGLERLFDYGCRMMLVRTERREAELLTMTAKQRFLQFIKNFPGYLDRIPQYHIASYLGITPVALSKYKKQWLESQ